MSFKDYIVQISLRDKDQKEKYIGSEANWELAEKYLNKSKASVKAYRRISKL